MEAAQLVDEESLSQRIIRAMNHEDLDQIKALVTSEAPLQDIKDANKDTLVHIAVRRNNPDILQYVLDLEKIDIDSFNTLGRTPLLMAALQRSPNATKMLIEKGANINLADNVGNSPLHYAIYYNLQHNCLVLLQMGADVNAQNRKGFTPLHLVCEVNANVELAAMLIYYGADVGVQSWNEGWGYTPFELCLMHNRAKLQHFLADYVFDEVEKVPVVLEAFMGAMQHSSDLFFYVVDHTSHVLFDVEHLLSFLNKLVYFNTAYLLVFLQKFDYIVQAISDVENRIPQGIFLYMVQERRYERIIDNLFVVFQEPFVSCFIENVTKTLTPNILLNLMQIGEKLGAPLEKLEGIFFHILSYGGALTNAVLDKAYHCWGETEFFRILLFMDFKTVLVYPEWTPFPAIIYDVNLKDINYYFTKPVIYQLNIFDILLQFFAGVRLKEKCFRTQRKELIEKAKQVPDVPLLLELARNVARNHIIKFYGISSSRQFCEVMRLLPLCEGYRDIITFKTRLYDFSV